MMQVPACRHPMAITWGVSQDRQAFDHEAMRVRRAWRALRSTASCPPSCSASSPSSAAFSAAGDALGGSCAWMPASSPS